MIAGYPGEYPGHNREIYDCTFKAMIDSWRQRWSDGTDGATGNFPFGFVQLGPFTDQKDHFAWPELRWRQTANKVLGDCFKILILKIQCSHCYLIKNNFFEHDQ